MNKSRYQIRQEMRGINDDIENLCKHLTYCTDERFDSIVKQIKMLREEVSKLQKEMETL